MNDPTIIIRNPGGSIDFAAVWIAERGRIELETAEMNNSLFEGDWLLEGEPRTSRFAYVAGENLPIEKWHRLASLPDPGGAFNRYYSCLILGPEYWTDFLEWIGTDAECPCLPSHAEAKFWH